MEDKNVQSQWSDAAGEGIILSLFTVLPSLLTAFVTNGAVSIIAWAVKTGGSLWLLFRFMKMWAGRTGKPSAFGYGFKVCLCSSLICSVWAFTLYKFIIPDRVTEVMDSLYTALGSQMAAAPEVEEAMLLLEDNFAQLNGICTLIGCVFCGLLFSAIFSRSAAASGIFPNRGDNSCEDEEL